MFAILLRKIWRLLDILLHLHVKFYLIAADIINNNIVASGGILFSGTQLCNVICLSGRILNNASCVLVFFEVWISEQIQMCVEILLTSFHHLQD